MRHLLAAFAVVLGSIVLAGCADPLIGTYTYTGTVTSMLTQPIVYNQPPSNVMGTLTISPGTGADYSLDFLGSAGSDHCVFNALRNGSGLTIPAGQTCAITVNNGSATATITSGSGVVNGNTIMFAVQYSVSGNSGALAIVGTGSQVINATRTAN